ncbi:carboxypeptidase-like regulatory domain-containing protein [Paraflavitalea speifideaquila]|uniref:carboxypeptidase-like regulatory domain-containing protein n=1 Tax=Paraflavitalea speifideaquila TaxID=3076558 RepID=UPI0028E70E8D|nr:carboxypeptidase-like regulatory domain-containing protein [Paraflavitalea speifideiaquila]
MLVLYTVLAFAQTKTVTGKITDELGDPVPFATVVLKGTKIAFVSDASGTFSAKVKSGDVLVISAQSLTTKEVTVGATNVVAITLTKNNNALAEVVVTGAYGTKKHSVLLLTTHKLLVMSS